MDWIPATSSATCYSTSSITFLSRIRRLQNTGPTHRSRTRAFYEMFTAWIGIMKRQIVRHGFYDAFGDLFMALNPQRELQRQGQFLTPEEIADLCQRIVAGHGRKVDALRPLGWTSRSTSGSAGPTLLLTSSFSTAKAMTTTSGGAKHGGGFRPCAITGRDRRQIRPRRRPQGTKRKRTIRYLTFKM